MIDVLAQGTGTDVDRRFGALYAGVAHEARDVELVGAASLNRRALLESEEIVKALDEECPGYRVFECLTHAFSRDVSIARSPREATPTRRRLLRQPCRNERGTSGQGPNCPRRETPET